jgi:hypothetical protein
MLTDNGFTKGTLIEHQPATAMSFLAGCGLVDPPFLVIFQVGEIQLETEPLDQGRRLAAARRPQQ